MHAIATEVPLALLFPLSSHMAPTRIQQRANPTCESREHYPPDQGFLGMRIDVMASGSRQTQENTQAAL